MILHPHTFYVTDFISHTGGNGASASSDGGGGGGGRIVGFGNSADSKSKSVISESQTHTREKHHSLTHSLTH